MTIGDFIKLEKKITGETFNESYKTINNVMIFLSYFGHIASVFLAYFLLSKVISGAIIDNQAVVFISSIILLAGMEYLKRSIFDKFAIQYLKFKTINNAVKPLLILSVLIIGVSFYASIKGASEFSSKSNEIENVHKENVVKVTSDIEKRTDSIINTKNMEITAIKINIDGKDKEQTEISSNPTRSQLKRISDIKQEKDILRKDIQKIENDISKIKEDSDKKAKDKSSELEKETDKKKTDNSSNSIMFVIISTLIELTILAGVYFNEFYKFRSYNEYRNRIEKDSGFKKWELYDKMLDVLYTEDTKINQKLPSNKSIVDICKVNDLIILPKDMSDFIKIITGIGIIKSSGSAKYITKPIDIAKEALMKHFNIE